MPGHSRGLTAKPLGSGASLRAEDYTLWAALTALAALSAFATHARGTPLWSLAPGRFLSPWVAWVLLLAPALALIPMVARRTLAAAEAVGLALARGGARSATLLALLAAALVWALPDRVHFTGDFLLRETAFTRADAPSQLFPQALPLDLWLHVGLPRALAARGMLTPDLEGRVLGAIEAAILMLLLVRFVRRSIPAGAAAVAALAVCFFGGWLALDTGFNKAFSELALCAAAIGVFGIEAMEGTGGPLPAGIAAALAIALHRSGIAFLPAALYPSLVIAMRPGDPRRAQVWPASILPLALLALTMPRTLHILRDIDLVRLAPWSSGAHGAAGRASGGLRDAANAALTLLPGGVALALASVAPWMARAQPSRRVLLALMIAPLILALTLVRPPQGMFRDWDMFAAPALLAAVGLAWTLADPTWSSARRGWLLVGLIAFAAAHSLGLLMVQSDFESGMARVRSFVTEPPAPSDDVRARTWGFLAMRYFQLRDWDAVALSADSAATWGPSKTILSTLAVADEARGDYAGAQSAYRRAIERDDGDWRDWVGLGEVSLEIGDVVEARRAARGAVVLHAPLEFAHDFFERMRAESLGSASGARK